MRRDDEYRDRWTQDSGPRYGGRRDEAGWQGESRGNRRGSGYGRVDEGYGWQREGFGEGEGQDRQYGYGGRYGQPAWGDDWAQGEYGSERWSGQRPPGAGYGRSNPDGPQYEQGGRYPGTRPYGDRQWAGSEWAGRDERYGRRQSYDPKGYTRSDERVREHVCEHLSRSGLDVRNVEVKVKDGQVMLEGHVPDRRTKHEVEDCADDCVGVRDVENRLRIDSGAGTSLGAGSGRQMPGQHT
jgi:hypothetical protein